MATRFATGKIRGSRRFAGMRSSLFLLATSVATVSCVDDGAEPEPASSSSAIALLEARRTTLGLGAGDGFAERSVRDDARGGRYVRVEQRYRGLPVLGGNATLHVGAAGNDLGLTDALLRGIALDTTPVLAPRGALAALERAAHPHAYAAEPRIVLAILPERTRVRRATGLPLAAAPPAIRENAADVERRVTGYRLVYQVETAEVPPKRQLIAYVDAKTGELISWRDSASYHENLAHTFFNGDQMIDVTSTQIPNFFELVDHTRSNSWVWDEDVADGDIMVDGDGVWGDGKSFIPIITSRQTAAVDCMFGMSVTWDMFENVFGWTGMDGNGVEIEMGVHDPDQFNGACFNDFDNNLYFGDSNLTGGQMCALDIVGHEYGHAVMDKTADVGGGVGESGGLNEAYSDAWGILSRIYKKQGGFAAGSSTIPSTPFADRSKWWQLRIDLDDDGRSMFAPSIKYWNSILDDTEEHAAAGPMDRALFFLAQGSEADVTSNTWSHSLPWGMTGLGNTKAAKIWFRTVTHHLQSGDGYFEARDRTITAVRDLFAQNGDEEKAVRNAFAGIDVGDPAANAPAAPASIGEQEPNDDHAHAQSVSFTSTNADVPGLRKIDVVGTGTSNDEFKFTLACGKTFGARLESIGDYDIKVFQDGNSTALDSSAKAAFEDDVVSLSSSAGCTGSTTFFVRVIFFAGPSGNSNLAAYVLHLDKKD